MLFRKTGKMAFVSNIQSLLKWVRRVEGLHIVYNKCRTGTSECQDISRLVLFSVR